MNRTNARAIVPAGLLVITLGLVAGLRTGQLGAWSPADERRAAQPVRERATQHDPINRCRGHRPR